MENYIEISTLLQNVGLPHEQLHVYDKTSLKIKLLLATKEAKEKRQLLSVVMPWVTLLTYSMEQSPS
jgi:hypothetical protein